MILFKPAMQEKGGKLVCVAREGFLNSFPIVVALLFVNDSAGFEFAINKKRVEKKACPSFVSVQKWLNDYRLRME